MAHELPGSAAAEASGSTPPRSRAEKKLVRQLENYFSGNKTAFEIAEIPLDRSLWTPFQTRVAEALAAVPYGTTVTYSELAAAAGYPLAYRAVGNCMAANPYPVIIPCHRVVKSGGSLGSFSAGIEWKARLLGLEGLPVPE
ncbi:MAG: methylated-DNA--[protein]-cysteine S-methyltransferase [Actinobacteria bacterium]|nr:methylated-DNA--[protein]-cysteine S-methyltransferase [Actinomycetota bacterium]